MSEATSELCFSVCRHLGPSGKAVRQYFPYVSSESDLQRYRAITLHKHPSNDTRASSSLSNGPSDSTRMKVILVDIFIQAHRLGKSFRHKIENLNILYPLHVLTIFSSQSQKDIASED